MNVADILTKHGADQDAHTKVKPITVDVGTGSDLSDSQQPPFMSAQVQVPASADGHSDLIVALSAHRYLMVLHFCWNQVKMHSRC